LRMALFLCEALWRPCSQPEPRDGRQ
jgi:hypothetical protein